MYQKYHTDALVLGGRDFGEADRMLALYTREFGLVRGRCGGVRAGKSKMRYALQNYSLANVALVKGRSGWRLAGAAAISVANERNEEGIMAFARISRLVMRFVAGEEAHEHLFEILRGAHSALMQESCEAWATIELVCVARIMHALGYISSEALKTALLTHTTYTEESLREAGELRDEILRTVNHAISETHL
ncbi:MAG: recombination protein O N-terminal domain-containing protein [bacterium]|nr:recombination protein O N-terminal domain-containing protein [bacterium]